MRYKTTRGAHMIGGYKNTRRAHMLLLCHNVCLFAWWCLTPLSTIFRLYRGGQFYRWRKLGDPAKNTDIASHWQTLSHNVVHLSLVEIQTHNISVIGTDCTGSCKFNYHTITRRRSLLLLWIRVIRKLLNSKQSSKGKVKTHKYINRQNQSTTGKLWKP
jgi:hypothetical protein